MAWIIPKTKATETRSAKETVCVIAEYSYTAIRYSWVDKNSIIGAH
jgi:hypothetical protein